MASKSKPTGTPREGVNTRLTAELRAKLSAAAEAAGRSVGAEIEHRLLASFAAERPSLTAEDVRQIVREEMGRGKDAVPTITRCGTCDREQFFQLCTRVECPRHSPIGGFGSSHWL